MKKTYITPKIKVENVESQTIMAASAQYVDPGTGEKEPIGKDDGDDGWASSKADRFELWED